MKTVKQMYQRANQTQTALLSNYTADFWEEYKSNYDRFDNVFVSLFKSFIYFDQEEDETIEEVTTHFINQVYNWLLMNSKRYSEMWRINVIADNEKYSITDNYYLTETYSGSNSNQGAMISGQRTDINNTQVGSQNTGNVNKVTAFNSNTENTNTSNTQSIGTRQDIEQFTKGQETDTTQSTGSDAHTLTRSGQIGVMTADDVMLKHENFWKSYNFYMFVFNEIRDKFLLVGCNEW